MDDGRPATESAHEVTRLLAEWSRGDSDAYDRLSAVIGAELHRLAATYLRRERPDHTLQPTELIHEAYLRLVGQGQPDWRDRSHFFSFAAHLMRQILVDHARRRHAARRGAGVAVVALDDRIDVAAAGESPDLLALDDALEKLAGLDRRKSQALELRFFSGMKVEEIAQALDISVATVGRELRMGQAWLRRELADGKPS